MTFFNQSERLITANRSYTVTSNFVNDNGSRVNLLNLPNWMSQRGAFSKSLEILLYLPAAKKCLLSNCLSDLTEDPLVRIGLREAFINLTEMI